MQSCAFLNARVKAVIYFIIMSWCKPGSFITLRLLVKLHVLFLRILGISILILGWSFLEGIGAALIMPAVVTLVAVNFVPQRRPSAYGTIAAAGAIAVAVGPLIGGAFTTYASWRYVFV